MSLKSFLNRLWLSSRSINDSFLSGTSSQYLEEMYNAWLKNPSSVDPSWDSYFKSATGGKEMHTKPSGDGGGDNFGITGIIRAFQYRGHFAADIDPLGITKTEREAKLFDTLGGTASAVLKRYNLGDKSKEFFAIPPITYIANGESKLTLEEIYKRLTAAYCGYIGTEYIHIDNYKEREFVKVRLETPGVFKTTTEEKQRTLKRLIETSELELFMGRKWPAEKRFGVEGCEMAIPGIKEIVDKSSAFGVENFFIGIAHRGRMNLLALVCKRPMYQIFNTFDTLESVDYGSGDVKYHLGSFTELINSVTKKNMKITVLANPSHLESVNSTVIGRTRAEQFYTNDVDGTKSVAILIHGDASFAGQGINYETLCQSILPCFTTHGVFHIIINNQIGFTTDPRFSRSSPYCSDLARVNQAPIFHVNGNQPDSVIYVCKIAAEFRAQFKKDVFIDMVGYRKFGHNETDEPSFTQPLMYKKIREMKPTQEKYTEQLIAEKIVTEDQVKKIREDFLKKCEDEYQKSRKETSVLNKIWLDTWWKSFFNANNSLKMKPTGVPEDVLGHIGKVFSSPPPVKDFIIHKGIERMLHNRMKLVENKEIDWSLAEAMAFGSLLKEGVHVRITGEDVERGTFSHRHHVLHHQTQDRVTYNTMQNLYPNQAKYIICNSSLSEYGVLAFEMGYAQTNPNSLVIWEAQFGDFANTAQCIFDNFLSGGEAKWVRQNGLVVLLPHGFEGQGPEHSSARPERFLMMCDDDPDKVPPLDGDFVMKQLRDSNWIIANCSTPANFFHLLRRQLALPFRKPLVVFTPKSLLRLPECRSSFKEMVEGTEFKRLIPDPASTNPSSIKKLIFCTGKVYYDAVKVRNEKNLQSSISISRIEQISPFPFDLIKAECEKYPEAKLCWLQEEHKNGGAYVYALHRINTLLKNSRHVSYIGREVAAAIATGNKVMHKHEVKHIADGILAL